MKVLILSDLHIDSKGDVNRKHKTIMSSLDENIELVVICGDIFESYYECNPYKQLYRIFGDEVPVVCVLGNHEFFKKTINETIEHYSYFYNPDKYNIHYLDVVGHYDVGEFRFFGNVLWYDGSMATIPNQNPNIFTGKVIDEHNFNDDKWFWMDGNIKNFDCIKANKECVNQIMFNHGGYNRVNVLCTHCCPHSDLNLHLDKITSPFNVFSGMTDLLSQVKPDYAFCGHTHRRIVGKYIGNCKCVNVGSGMDYIESFIIDM